MQDPKPPLSDEDEEEYSPPPGLSHAIHIYLHGVPPDPTGNYAKAAKLRKKKGK
jgi:hypothetical protein